MSNKDTGFNENLVKVNKIQEEFDILAGGDLETDPFRTPEHMHMHLLEVEGQYNMLADAIESYKRRIIMLEESLPAHEDAGIYWWGDLRFGIYAVCGFSVHMLKKSLNPMLNEFIN